MSRSNKHGRGHRTPHELPVGKLIGRADAMPGIAVAAACDDCAHHIGNPEPTEDGTRGGIIHLGHVAELEQLGWILTEDGDGGPPDITCEHFHRAHWQGDHNECCAFFR